MWRVTLTQLAYFVAVVETGSFTGAARREHVAQPSLSQQIRALERELGGPLLERLPQGVRLTAAGRALLPKARVAVQAVADGRTLAGNALVDGPDALCVAVVGGTPLEPVARAIASLRAARPQLTVRLHVHADAARLHELILEGERVVAVGPPPAAWEGPVTALGERELVLATAADADDERLHDGVALADLADRTWIALDQDGDRATAALADAGVEPGTLLLASHLDALLALVAAGAGVALVDPAALAGRDGLRGVPVAEAPTCLCAAFGNGPWTPAARELVDRLAAQAATAPSSPPSMISS
ncbi:transcriptional regulator, LysR family [Conexibacter woesei DSM 14684]|uniref:Transcriptional regulator, LysR family n=1 Tax=Conexibacter woesei (strain DSM 14684 / CCUG 47730 / CIP 108061 / JCM 11494 / NBRC 100937 / ID131577) TaxID=469383 RepID=D3EYW3_CONWI|nr:transcriptional regulator, LysR family [Conexibacter woesei DSM 14684]